MSMHITIKRQPRTTWPPSIPRVQCHQLKAFITPGQCRSNQETARQVKREFLRRGMIVMLWTRDGQATGFTMTQLTRFRACAMCSKCRQVTEGDLQAALKSCADAVQWFESIPLDTVSPEVRERVKRDRNRRRYEKRKEKNEREKCGQM